MERSRAALPEDEKGQRLYRAETRDRRTTAKRFRIGDEWFDSAIIKLNEQLSTVSRVRLPFTSASEEE